jgi:type I restriction enzyme, R subunit
LDLELQKLRAELSEIRSRMESIPDTHDYSEKETRKYIIDVDLRKAGWYVDKASDTEFEVEGMPNSTGKGYVDYVLWGDDGKPLAVLEAKKTTLDPSVGQQQAKLYADCLEKMFGQRPILFFTNGYHIWIWDDLSYPPRRVSGYYKKEELHTLIQRRTQKKNLNVSFINENIVERYYQKRAIGSILEQFSASRRKVLLVMATGTGKTRTAIALVDVLQKTTWAKRILFLADRISLVKQTVNEFKKHMPDSSPVNLVSDKDKDGRVYVSTYPTMLNLIDETEKGEARFGVGYFDLLIIDEAHRSVYQKYGTIFQYFDSLLLGLTATPREEVDRNTYNLFDLEEGVPTDAYELETAVRDGFLVPPNVQVVDLKFPGRGIDYNSLSEEEKARWENTDWGEESEEDGLPDFINPEAINSWLFNKDTVDKALKHLMENGLKVEGGDRLAKTILFARNHDHAKFIEERFNFHYPYYKGNFARVIDTYEKYAQDLIDKFCVKHENPHIAISVDMLDTGIDVPEVANLVFFKPVYSRIKFWQMIGRGTRLCPELFAPTEDKTHFRIFDFCNNFDFFKENPRGIETGGNIPLGKRLFMTRVDLLRYLNLNPELDQDKRHTNSIVNTLYDEVSSMNKDNFIVRMNLTEVERFQNRSSWESLKEDDYIVLQKEISGLPAEKETDKIESRLFDLTSLKMQIQFLEGDAHKFENNRLKVVEIAELLSEKITIPAIKEQIEYLNALQESSFWEGMNLDVLEEIRLKLRKLVPFLDRKNKKIVYTDFADEILAVREEESIPLVKMTGKQYEKKVKEFLLSHQDQIVIHRLKNNLPLTPTDLEGLEKTLIAIGEEEGSQLLNHLLERSGAPTLPWFVRSLVGLDRTAAQKAFSKYLNDKTLGSSQIRFVELIIDQLTARGVMQSEALYEPPFLGLHSGGPDELFTGKENIIEGIFESLAEVHSGVVKRAV